MGNAERRYHLTERMAARVIGSELAIANAYLARTFDENGRSACNVQAINEVDAKYNAGKQSRHRRRISTDAPV